MAPFLQYLFSAYGFFGTMLICGVLMLNCTAMGALYRPLRLKYVNQDFHDSKPLKHSNHTNIIAKQMVMTDNFGSVHSIHTKSNLTNEQGHEGDMFQNEVDKKDNSDGELTEDESPNTNKEKPHSCFQIVLGSCSRGLDLALLRNTEYMALSLLSAFAITIAITNMIFLANYAESKSFTPSDLTFLLMAMNFAEIPMRLLSGFLFDLHCVRRNGLVVYALFCMLSGISTGLLAVSDDKVYCYIIWIAQESILAITLVQYTTVMTDIIGETYITHELN